MITYYENKDGKFSEADKSEEAVWLDVECPSGVEIEFLTEKFDLPSDYLTDILDDDENSRVEIKDGVPNLILFQYPIKMDADGGYYYVDTFPYAIILTLDRKIITVGNHRAPFREEILQFNLMDEHLDDYLFFEIAWRLTKKFGEYLKELKAATRRLETDLLSSTENKQLYEMVQMQKTLVLFEAALQANRGVLREVYSSKTFDAPDIHDKIQDILISNEQSLTTTRIQMKLLDNISDTFESIVSNNLNIVMKVLTSLTVVLTVPTIVSGIYGMNVKLPFMNEHNAFLFLMIATLLACVLVIVWLKRKKMM
jgi:magnesium transporter